MIMVRERLVHRSRDSYHQFFKIINERGNLLFWQGSSHSTLPATVPLSPTSPSPPPALPTASSFQPDQLPHQPRPSSAHLTNSLLRRGGVADNQSTVLEHSIELTDKGHSAVHCQGAEGTFYPAVTLSPTATRQSCTQDLSPPEVNMPVANRLPQFI